MNSASRYYSNRIPSPFLCLNGEAVNLLRATQDLDFIINSTKVGKTKICEMSWCNLCWSLILNSLSLQHPENMQIEEAVPVVECKSRICTGTHKHYAWSTTLNGSHKMVVCTSKDGLFTFPRGTFTEVSRKPSHQILWIGAHHI